MLTSRLALGLALASTSLFSPGAHAEEKQLLVGDTSAMTVVRDAATGKLRAPTAEERAELQALQASRRSAARLAAQMPRTKHHGNGATGVRLTEEFMSYSVMVRRPDGTLVEHCFRSKEEADAAVKNGTLLDKAALPTE